MALEGSLRDFDLFSLFNMIKSQGKSGTLVLSRSRECVKIFFEGGEIVGCEANQVPMEDRVGAMLVRLGRLSAEEVQALVQRQRQTLKRIGTLLLESGRVTGEDLQEALAHQALAVIYRLFRWLEGDYRFDSMLPPDLERDPFPAIPVDTVLMEAARIMDEWPQVQRRLPDPRQPLARTRAGEALDLGGLAGLVGGNGQARPLGSGLGPEQETVFGYFSEPASVQDVIQFSRYGELETCQVIADLLDRGLLAVSAEALAEPSQEPARRAAAAAVPSRLFWPAVCLLLAGPLAWYGPGLRTSLDQGLASLQRPDWTVAADPDTRDRQAWAFAMAAPADGGAALARSLGIRLPVPRTIPDYSRQPDPLLP